MFLAISLQKSFRDLKDLTKSYIFPLFRCYHFRTPENQKQKERNRKEKNVLIDETSLLTNTRTPKY